MKASSSPQKTVEVVLNIGRRSLPNLDFRALEDPGKNDSRSHQERGVNKLYLALLSFF
jgi:hypothetical protein